jgi:hypothetical protein
LISTLKVAVRWRSRIASKCQGEEIYQPYQPMESQNRRTIPIRAAPDGENLAPASKRHCA